MQDLYFLHLIRREDKLNNNYFIIDRIDCKIRIDFGISSDVIF